MHSTPGLLALLAVIGIAACDEATRPSPPPIQETFTFPQDLSGWQPRAIEVFVGDDEIEWTIEHSQEESLVGPASVRFFVHNRSDAARLWIEREYALDPSADYDVRVQFGFATRDWSDVNLWRVLAGALADRPETPADFGRVVQGTTRAGPPPGEDFVWQERDYSVPVRAGSDGRIYVVIGIWGTSEFPRTYFVDDVRITIRRL